MKKIMKKMFILTLFASALLFSFSPEISEACKTGGEGATACSYEATIMGTGISNSVTCGDGYYACCGVNGAGCVDSNQSYLSRKWDEIWA